MLLGKIPGKILCQVQRSSDSPQNPDVQTPARRAAFSVLTPSIQLWEKPPTLLLPRQPAPVARLLAHRAPSSSFSFSRFTNLKGKETETLCLLVHRQLQLPTIARNGPGLNQYYSVDSKDPMYLGHHLLPLHFPIRAGLRKGTRT